MAMMRNITDDPAAVRALLPHAVRIGDPGQVLPLARALIGTCSDSWWCSRHSHFSRNCSGALAMIPRDVAPLVARGLRACLGEVCTCGHRVSQGDSDASWCGKCGALVRAHDRARYFHSTVECSRSHALVIRELAAHLPNPHAMAGVPCGVCVGVGFMPEIDGSNMDDEERGACRTCEGRGYMPSRDEPAPEHAFRLFVDAGLLTLDGPSRVLPCGGDAHAHHSFAGVCWREGWYYRTNMGGRGWFTSDRVHGNVWGWIVPRVYVDGEVVCGPNCPVLPRASGVLGS